MKELGRSLTMVIENHHMNLTREETHHHGSCVED